MRFGWEGQKDVKTIAAPLLQPFCDFAAAFLDALFQGSGFACVIDLFLLQTGNSTDWGIRSRGTSPVRSSFTFPSSTPLMIMKSHTLDFCCT